MKLSLKFLFFFLAIFLLNILFYFVSADYRFFVSHLKHSNNEEMVDSLIEEYSAPPLDVGIIKMKDTELWLSADNEEELWEVSEEKKKISIKKQVVLWKNYKDILNRFTSEYVLKKIEVNSSLFELTWEYPDYYYEYYSKDVTLYLFPTRTYKEVFDIFDYLSNNLPFSLNEINNFWDHSFYVNLREDVADNFVRLVISEGGITFWLKIKKDEYNSVKNILLLSDI